MAEFSRSALDRLGDRLRRQEPAQAEDRDMYDEYRAGFADAMSEVQSRCHAVMANRRGEGARLKTLESTVAKLRRGTIRLSTVADIAGVRYVLPTLIEQEQAAEAIQTTFDVARVIDYRDDPQNGYRAVHLLVASTEGRTIEVQLRTVAQDVWANACERFAARFDGALKYGQGPALIQDALSATSRMWREWDLKRDEIREIEAHSQRLLSQNPASRAPEGRAAIQAQLLVDELVDELNEISAQAGAILRDTWATWRTLDEEMQE